MGGGTGNDIGTIPTVRTVYTMRHAQNEFGSDDPSLTKRGDWQAVEAARTFLLNIEFDAVCHGIYTRHRETAKIAEKILGLSCKMIEAPLLALTKATNDRAYQCVKMGRNHPEGTSVGFRVDTWFKTDNTLMHYLAQQLQDFFGEIPKTSKNILAVSSSPVLESLVLKRKETQLLGHCGIICYTIKNWGKFTSVINSEVIFEGFFEKPPQKSE
ncbi:MAG: hypothetical protein ACD_7C00403G0001 [uncultured bacterium]|nr:MAG: hypothetical protein ACD_7C00403G0001 [uncultured bacterium]KKP69020.1 MAG: hypothetical protein UR66_C0002G0077 [Candidatus Moranbacteria bacterium GW2011_GWE1_35_17]KKP74394.1 MAG: hypothetical protein UR65_C0001G0011 [Candidatus Moranbacteria bacterium GW2011_GWE2_35_164]KKP84122.1 MAG: hypothetical protein UR82_C0012G0018 [Candidatus Moranbacteria bacterium GW2011_GWF1_35_5]KKP85303.1 MAG: hypothetical protein UR83_C0001G0010 [Candidatus Moranbacteria bacterium GW2011_GWF2_35_54]